MFVDSQLILKDKIAYPKLALDMADNYIRDYEDKLLESKTLFVWLFTICELLFQFPFFFVATYAIYFGKRN